MCWFDTYIFKMITAVVLANNSITSHNYHFFLVVRTVKRHSLSNFQVYNTLLSMIMIIAIAMWYITSSELNSFGSLYPLTKSPLPSSTSSQQPPFHSLILWIWLFQTPHVFGITPISVFLWWLFQFAKCILKLHPCCNIL